MCFTVINKLHVFFQVLHCTYFCPEIHVNVIICYGEVFVHEINDKKIDTWIYRYIQSFFVSILNSSFLNLTIASWCFTF